MAEQKRWRVEFTAKREVIRRECRQVMVFVTEDEVRKLLELETTQGIDTIPPQLLEDALTEIATDRGQFLDQAWETTASEDKVLDPDDFEINEETP
jgi:hypothetical protein